MHQKNQTQHRSTLSHSRSNSDENEQKKDFLYACQTFISNIEIQSSFFYIIMKLQMLIIAVVSSLSFYTYANRQFPINSKIEKVLSVAYISPPYFGEITNITYFVIRSILYFNVLMTIFILTIGRKIRNNSKMNVNIIKLWIIITQLFLPIQGHIIGYFYGYYVGELTHSIYFNELSLITFTGMFWCWTVITSNAIYNPFKRKEDICQVKHSYNMFHNIIVIFPMIQAMGPSLTKVFFKPTYMYVYSILLFFISLFISIFIIVKKPYHVKSMNRYVIFLFIARMFLSLTLMIQIHYPIYFEYYIVFLIILIILISIMAINSSPFIQPSNSSNNKKADNSDFFDPTINLPFPFNRVSLTKTDIILYVFVFSCVIFMEILNAIAAQLLMPAANPLPDFIHNRFIISKCIRSNFTNTYSQISNDFILFQIALLFFILFVFPQHFDFRRSVLIYGFICIIRAISFILTSLPVPCAGDPNCPCADRKILKALRAGNPVKIAMSWLFGLGMFLKYPECGDLIISGHTVCIWLFTRTCSAALNSALERPFSWLVSGILYTFSFFSMGYIIMAKNHYSIDVWFGLVITEMMWIIYNALLKLSMMKPRKNDSFAVRLIRWIEIRPPKRELVVYNEMKEEMTLKNLLI